jgi:hypothetical protein
MRSRTALPLAVAAALLVGGCGGDSGSGTSGTDVDKAEYVDQVNAICEQSSKDAEVAIAPIVEGAKDASKTDVVADALEVAMPITREAIAEAANLPRPAEDEELLRDFWSRLEDSYPVYEQLIEAIRSGDEATVSKVDSDLAEIAADTRPVAEDYGLISCIPDAPSS